MPSIHSLPLEILRELVSFLDFREVCTLAAADNTLSTWLLGSETACAELVKKHISESYEATLAYAGHTTYRTAIINTFRRREAFATSRPISLLVVGEGSDFHYREGTLCYLREDAVHVLNVHQADTTELVINLAVIFGQTAEAKSRTRLLHYQDNVLVVLNVSNFETRLVALNTKRQTIPGKDRVLICQDLDKSNGNCRKEFVRHNATNLVYGSYSDDDEVDNYKWQFWAFDLGNGKGCELECMSLNFATSAINSSIVFEVVDGYFYVATSQITVDPEGSDPTSYYGGCRFALREAKPRAEYWRVWRRQHREGAIHDLWTDLALHKDENGELLITETRREWQVGNFKPVRTFYRKPLRFQDAADNYGLKVSMKSTLLPLELDEQSSGPAPEDPNDERESSVESTLSTFESDSWSPHRHLPRHSHPEYTDAGMSGQHDNYEYTVSNTKYRGYDTNCSTFVDIVNDRRASSPNQICLRMGSRIQACPLDHEGLLHKMDIDEETGEPIPDSDERFVDRGITLWPPSAPPPDIQELLTTGKGRFKAISDERSLIYTTCLTGINAPIVMVNFDPAIRFGGLKEWRLDAAVPRPATNRHPGEAESVEIAEQSDLSDKEVPRVRIERAMWRAAKGFQLR